MDLLREHNPRMAEILKLRFLEGATRQEIAEKLNVHVTRVKELETAALNYLKRISKGEHLTMSRRQIPERPTSIHITPEKQAELEKIPLNFFVCFKIKRPKGREEIMVDFSAEFYRLGNGKMSSCMLAYKKDTSGNPDEESKRKLRAVVLEIRNLTGFSAENLLKKKELLENEYNSGMMSEEKRQKLIWAERG